MTRPQKWIAPFADEPGEISMMVFNGLLRRARREELRIALEGGPVARLSYAVRRAHGASLSELMVMGSVRYDPTKAHARALAIFLRLERLAGARC